VWGKVLARCGLHACVDRVKAYGGGCKEGGAGTARQQCGKSSLSGGGSASALATLSAAAAPATANSGGGKQPMPRRHQTAVAAHLVLRHLVNQPSKRLCGLNRTRRMGQQELFSCPCHVSGRFQTRPN
jgi:hypothetical protein